MNQAMVAAVVTSFALTDVESQRNGSLTIASQATRIARALSRDDVEAADEIASSIGLGLEVREHEGVYVRGQTREWRIVDLAHVRVAS